jgi:hypothetical protein
MELMKRKRGGKTEFFILVAVWARLKLEGVAQFSLSPGKSPAVAVFIPEKNVKYILNHIKKPRH